MINPYYAEIYPDQGYSEIFGDYVRIKNLKDLYEIPVYGKFDLNDLGIIYYLLLDWEIKIFYLNKVKLILEW